MVVANLTIEWAITMGITLGVVLTILVKNWVIPEIQYKVLVFKNKKRGK